MSFKQGLPLLKTVEDDDDYEEEDFDPSYTHQYMPKGKFPFRVLCKKKFLLLAGITLLVSLLLVVVLVVVGVTQLQHLRHEGQDQEVQDQEVVHSELDNRVYKTITLSNHLRVLLVSDADAEKSAAAMDVAVGSFSNPSDYEGLAHFCEHMLFYSSDKYPEEGGYQAFLSVNGGYSNAFTSSQDTNYFFKVNTDYLEEALDRFAQFFISPRFVSNATSREVNAVNAEHSKNLQNDLYRINELMKSVSNPAHPFSMFSTGNLDTLDKPGVLEQLKSFYSSHYSANQMQLVVYGKEDVETLTQYVKNSFSAVRNSNAKRPDFAPKTSYPDGYNGRLVYYLPVADSDNLLLLWQVPPLVTKYRNQVSQFLSYILGHEGHGSATHVLRKKGWVFSLSAGTYMNTDTYTLLTIDLSLSEVGLKSVSDVVKVLVQYVLTIADATDDQLKEKWDDFVEICSLNFKYAPKDDPDSFASDVASTMRDVIEPADFLNAPSRFELNIAAIRDTLDSMDPSKLVIFVGSRLFSNMSLQQESNVSLPLPSTLSMMEPIYGIHYETRSITQSLVDYWNKRTTDMHLPDSPTMFIPTDFDILPSPQPPVHIPMDLNSDKDEGLSVWWLQDTHYQTPKVNIYCDINSPQTAYSLNDPQWTALTDLYTKVVSTSLTSDIYAATLTGYFVDLSTTAHGVRLSIQGYSDTNVLEEFVRGIVNTLHNETMLGDDGVFSLARESLINSLRNYNYTAFPFRYSLHYIQNVVMSRPAWKNWQLINELENSSVTPSLLLGHMKSLLHYQSSVLCFTHGNINQSKTLSLARMVHTVVKTGGQFSMINPAGQFYGRRVQLSSPGNYSIITPTLNPNDTNSVVNVVYQIGKECEVDDSLFSCSNSSLRRRALLELLTLKIKQSCFEVLRSKLQLGYAVFCLSSSTFNTNSFQVLIQSGTKNASDVLASIDTFLEHYRDNLVDISSTDFKSLQSVYNDVVENQLNTPLTLSEASNVYWNQINTGLLQFDISQQLQDVTDDLTASDLLEFYDSYILDLSRAKKLVIAVYGKDRSSDLNTTFKYTLDYTYLQSNTIKYP